jgi:hypothetical protein
MGFRERDLRTLLVMPLIIIMVSNRPHCTCMTHAALVLMSSAVSVMFFVSFNNYSCLLRVA